MAQPAVALRRPALKPALRRIWRDRSTLQFGIDPERAILLGGVDDAMANWLDRLDGSRDREGVITAAASAGVEESDAVRLLDLLAAAGALEDAASDRAILRSLTATERQRLAPDLAAFSVRREVRDGGAAALARRRLSAVAIHGAGRVGATVATLLAGAGIGYIVVRDPAQVRPADLAPGGLGYDHLGQRRDTAAVRAARRIGPTFRAALPPGRKHPDLAVLTPAGAPELELRDRLITAGVPHLHAGVRELVGIIGPLVIPGRTSCGRCHDLHRAERDPAWPRVAAQIAGAERGRQATTSPAPCDTVLATLVAAYTAANVLAFVDGEQPPTVDGTVEVMGLDGLVRRRAWEPHPACSCGSA